MTTFKQAVGEYIETSRENKGISKKDYSEIIGTDIKTLESWEAGLSMPPTRYLEQIAVLNGITVNELIDIANENKTVDRESAIVEAMTNDNGEAEDMPSISDESEYGHADESDENILEVPEVVKVGEHAAAEEYDPQLDESIQDDESSNDIVLTGDLIKLDALKVGKAVEQRLLSETSYGNPIKVVNENDDVILHMDNGQVIAKDNVWCVQGSLREFDPSAAPGLIVQREKVIDELIGEMERVLQQARELKTKRP